MRIIITMLLVIALMFSSVYSVAVDATETRQVLNEEGDQVEGGELPVIKDKNGNKIEIKQLDLSKISSDNLFLEQLKDMKYQYKRISKMNSDIKGWMWIDKYMYQPYADTPEDMQKYLFLNVYKEYNQSGTPFMSDRNQSNLNGNSLIYGHNMRNGTSFGMLKYLNNKENYKEIMPLVIYDGVNDEFIFYKIFSVSTIVDGIEYIKLKEFDSEKERIEYNKKLYQDTQYKIEDGWNIDWTKRAIFLQQCRDAIGDIRTVFGFYEYDALSGRSVDVSNYNPKE